MNIRIPFLTAMAACGLVTCVVEGAGQVSPTDQFVEAPLVGNPSQDPNAFYSTHATTDFNQDGKPDLLVANWSGGTYTLAVLLGDNKNHYASKTVSDSKSSSLGDPQVADMDGDGILDIVTASQGTLDEEGKFITEGAIDIYFGKGNGTFSEHLSVAVGQYSSWTSTKTECQTSRWALTRTGTQPTQACRHS